MSRLEQIDNAIGWLADADGLLRRAGESLGGDYDFVLGPIRDLLTNLVDEITGRFAVSES